MTITICGSCTFAEEMGKAAGHLKNNGIEVFTPEPLVTEEWYQENHSREDLFKMKPIWTKNHFERIKKSDAILILNHEKKKLKVILVQIH
ncbi:hypothetical protein D4R87_00180 [bacterium]|nr:MAG: hypothetical protein D4R87_00180 [bacterium]